jgi:hypothetical protein
VEGLDPRYARCAAVGRGMRLHAHVGGSHGGPPSAQAARSPSPPHPTLGPRRRLDFAEQLAFDARVAFARNLARGEAGMHLAEAALQVAAEDDAIGAGALRAGFAWASCAAALCRRLWRAGCGALPLSLPLQRCRVRRGRPLCGAPGSSRQWLGPPGPLPRSAQPPDAPLPHLAPQPPPLRWPSLLNPTSAASPCWRRRSRRSTAAPPPRAPPLQPLPTAVAAAPAGACRGWRRPRRWPRSKTICSCSSACGRRPAGGARCLRGRCWRTPACTRARSRRT